jgi:hypothetical protein
MVSHEGMPNLDHTTRRRATELLELALAQAAPLSLG